MEELGGISAPSCRSSWNRWSTLLRKYPNIIDAANTCAACILLMRMSTFE